MNLREETRIKHKLSNKKIRVKKKNKKKGILNNILVITKSVYNIQQNFYFDHTKKIIDINRSNILFYNSCHKTEIIKL